MSPKTHRARPRAEALEGRSLLSHAAPRLAHSSSPPPQQSVDVQASGTVFASDTTRIDVTLTRSAPNPAMLRRSLKFNFDGSYDTRSSPMFRPTVYKTVTFRPGEITKTIRLPICAVPAGAVDYGIVLWGSNAGAWEGPIGRVNVFPSPDRIPSGARLTPGLAPAFIDPSDPAPTNLLPPSAVS